MTEMSGWFFCVTIDALIPGLDVKSALWAVPFFRIQIGVRVFFPVFRCDIQHRTGHYSNDEKYEEKIQAHI